LLLCNTVTIKDSAPTAAALAYGKLRGDILRGVLVPLERLRVNDTSERYGCGAIPVREALNRLAAELTKARGMLMDVAMREAVLNGDAAWEERVLVAYHRLSKVPRYLRLEPRTPNPAYDGPHREFHSALVSGCGSQWMVSLCERLFDHAERYRNLSRKLLVAPREDEHKQIVDAALGRRLEDSIALSKRHVEITAEIILQHPDSDIR
jgi:DNA-binding GntR family transcriptional regulator